MSKKNRKQALYARPLPIILSSEKYGNLPEVFPHNPISWLLFTWKYLNIKYCRVPHSEFPHIEVVFEDGVFKCIKDDEMNILWRNGFFGKGTLSRSEPTWKERTIERLGLDANAKSGDLLMEDITTRRRDERNKFKNERSRLQEFELRQRKGELTAEDIVEMDKLKLLVSTLRNQEKLFSKDSEILEEDSNLFDPLTKELYKNLEFLQLQPVEVFYLVWLDCVKVGGFDMGDLFRVITGTTSIQKAAADPATTANHTTGNATATSPDHTTDNTTATSTPDHTTDNTAATSTPDHTTDNTTATSTPDHPVNGIPLHGNNKFLLDYVVYHHYRSLGWCVRLGIKFGTEFLLYKRGPPFSHAEYAVVIIPNDGSTIDWYQMASIGRVITTVKKNLVLAYVDYPSVETIQRILSEKVEPKQKFTNLFKHFKVTEILYSRWSPGRTRD